MTKSPSKKTEAKSFSYKNYEDLYHFISDRARIIPQKRTGLSPKKQRKLTQAIKHARHLGLLPFSSRI